jgi:hypothetical protein
VPEEHITFDPRFMISGQHVAEVQVIRRKRSLNWKDEKAPDALFSLYRCIELLANVCPVVFVAPC